MTALTVYVAVCDALLEPNPPGLHLGFLTLAQFLDYLKDTVSDMVQRTGVVKKLAINPAQFGVARYELPQFAMEVQEVFFNDTALFHSTGFSQDRDNSDWQRDIDLPVSWRNDRVGMKQFAVSPAPLRTGPVVPIAPQTGDHSLYTGFFGTIGGGSTYLRCDEPFFGILAGAGNGATYVETDGPLIGTVSDLQTSEGNLMSIVTAAPFNQGMTLGTVIEILPESMSMYLKYGVLAKVFSMDGELKDPQRAQYCAARVTEGVNLCKAIMGEFVDAGVK